MQACEDDGPPPGWCPLRGAVVTVIIEAPKKREKLKLADGVEVTLHPTGDRFRGVNPPGVPWEP